jgi:molecular chaperone GrpE (heat shock protein)
VYFRDRIVAAQVQRDSARVAELYAEVREWNQHAKGTGLEVVNIRDRVSKALRAQRLSASERFIKTTPLSSRDAAQRIVDVYVAN